VQDAAKQLYASLAAAGIEVVLDDRDLKPGVKFKDWDLLGIPWRIVCGRGVANGVVEVKSRSGAAAEHPIAEVANLVAERIRADLATLSA
jgi:prolyl-tRNA synthetase